jgi:hypothetical protein
VEDPKFESNIAMYNKPIKLEEGNFKYLVSFSTYFLVLMSVGSGDGLDFFKVPSGFNVNEFDDFIEYGNSKVKLLTPRPPTQKKKKKKKDISC